MREKQQGRLPKIGKPVAAVILALFVTAGCARAPRVDPVTVPQVLEMTQAGVPSSEIISHMRESRTVYRLDASSLADLRDQGVADEVINYMQETYLDAVRRDQRLREMRYWTPGGPGWWYRSPHHRPFHRWHYW
jgi:hypothetical protein